MLTEDILGQLRRVINSSQIVNSAVLTDFLTFVVTEALAGRGEQLKEYTIGVQALRKEGDFNPQIDSIVRIHAGRLRRALKEYYYEDGKEDPIIISIPKGSYTPFFTWKSDKSTLFLEDETPGSSIEPVVFSAPAQHHTHPSVERKPTVSVIPIKNIASDSEVHFFADGLSEYLSTELTHFQTIKVVLYTSNDDYTLKSPLHGSDMTEPTHFVLTGTVQWIKDRIRVWLQLFLVDSREQLWGQTFEKLISRDNYWEFQEEIVDHVLASLMGINGVISCHEMDKVDSLMDKSGISYPLEYWYFKHCRNFNLATCRQAALFYKEVIRDDPHNALAYAYLSEACSTEWYIFFGTNEKSLEDGLTYAHTAIKYDPHCQQGYHALAIGLLLRNDFKNCVAALEQGSLINPKSVDFRASMGAILIFVGEFERGYPLLESAFKLTPYLIWWQVIAFSHYSLHKGHYQDVIFWTERVEVQAPTTASTAVIKAAAHAHLGQFEKARESLAGMEFNSPEELLDISRLRKLFLVDEIFSKVLSGLKRLVNDKSVGIMNLS